MIVIYSINFFLATVKMKHRIFQSILRLLDKKNTARGHKSTGSCHFLFLGAYFAISAM